MQFASADNDGAGVLGGRWSRSARPPAVRREFEASEEKSRRRRAEGCLPRFLCRDFSCRLRQVAVYYLWLVRTHGTGEHPAEETIMAKSQKRSGREPKKPKVSKKKDPTPAYLVAESRPIQKIVPDSNSSKH